MQPGSPPSQGFRGFLKRCNRRAKKVFRPEPQVSAPRAPSPQPEPEPQPPTGASLPLPTPTQGPSPRPLAQSQQSPTSPRPAPSAGEFSSAANLAVDDGAQLTNVQSTTAKKVGADAWSGLRAALKLVENSSDVLPPLKSAIAGFLEVVGIFEVSDSLTHVVLYSLYSQRRQPHRTERTTQSLPRISRSWFRSSKNAQGSKRHPISWRH